MKIQERNIALCIVFTVITCGIYGLYWFVCLTDDVNAVAGESGTSGVLALVLNLVTCGIYGWYWAYQRGEQMDRVKRERGIAASNSGILYLILYILGVGVVADALIQNDLNKLAAW